VQPCSSLLLSPGFPGAQERALAAAGPLLADSAGKALLSNG